MNTDDILDYRRRLTQFSGIPALPEPTVYATIEWTDVVNDLTDQIGATEVDLQFPTAAECEWPWLETGVLIVFEKPVTLFHLTVSETGVDGEFREMEPFIEEQIAESMLFTPERMHRTKYKTYGDKNVVGPVPDIVPGLDPDYVKKMGMANHPAVGLTFIPPADASGVRMLSQAVFSFGWSVTVAPDREFPISHSMRFVYALLNAAGHRMTAHTPMVPVGNYARKRYVRAGQPPIRMLELTAPTADETDGVKVVNWKRSWKVRTHWRNQACGPKMRQHKKILIHSYWKQDHLPPDLRPTVWKTET